MQWGKHLCEFFNVFYFSQPMCQHSFGTCFSIPITVCLSVCLSLSIVAVNLGIWGCCEMVPFHFPQVLGPLKDLLTQNLRGWGQSIYANKPSRWLRNMLSFENTVLAAILFLSGFGNDLEDLASGSAQDGSWVLSHIFFFFF